MHGGGVAPTGSSAAASSIGSMQPSHRAQGDSSFGGPIHIIAPVDDAEDVVRQILASPAGECTVLDLSMGYIGAADTLGARVTEAVEQAGKRVTWRSGLCYAAELADEARNAQIQWLSAVSASGLRSGGSLRERFAYRDILSLWWLLPSSKHHPLTGAYGWLFYMLFALDRMHQESGPEREWHVWAADPSAAAALRGMLQLKGAAEVHVHFERNARARGWMWVRGFAQSLQRFGSAVRLLSRSVRLARTPPAAGLQHTIWHPASGGPRVVIHSVFPQFWTCPEDPAERPAAEATCFDRYFSDLPWRLRREGFQVAWMPAFYAGDLGRWQAILRAQDLPDTLPWMRLEPRQAMRVLVHLIGWTFSCAWLFAVERQHRRWCWRGIPLGRWLRDELWENATGGAAPALVQLEQQRAAIAALRPDLVLHRNEFLINGRVADAAANGLVRTIGVQHGLLARDVGVYQYAAGDIQADPGPSKRYDFVHHCPAPDVLAAFGEYYRDYFGRWPGFPRERVIPIGGIRHDRLVERFLENGRRDPDVRARLRASLQWPESEPVILLCTTFAREAPTWFSLLVRALRLANISAWVAIKPHPDHPAAELIRPVAAELGWCDYRVMVGNVYPMLAAADVLVAGASTTVLEAHLLDVPVVCLGLDHAYEAYPFREEGIGEVAATEVELAMALERILLDPPAYGEEFQKRRRFLLQRHLNNLDAQACARLSQLISSVAGGRDIHGRLPSQIPPILRRTSA